MIKYMYVAALVLLLGAAVGCGGSGGGNGSANAASNINVVTRTGSGTFGVAAVNCGVGEELVGGGCDCNGSALDDEAGNLFTCRPVGNGFVGGCYPRNVTQPIILIEAKALCSTSIVTSSASSAASAPLSEPLLDSLERYKQMIQSDVTKREEQTR